MTHIRGDKLFESRPCTDILNKVFSTSWGG